jgi:hypothetical protein
MTTTKSFKQQHVALPVAVTGMMAAPCLVRTKLLLYAALGFALGVAVTVSVLAGSSSYTTSTVEILRGGALDIFFPASPAATTANRSPAGVVHVRHNPPPAQPPATIPSRLPTEETSVRAAGAPPPPVADVVHVQPPPPPQPQQARPTPATIIIPSSPHQSQRQPPADGISVAATPPSPAVAGVSRGSGGFVVMDDEALLARAATLAPREVPAGAAQKKVAFLFLTRGDLPMAPLWEKFFEGHAGLYTVYVHTDPAFDGPEPPEGSAFFRRRIPSKVHSLINYPRPIITTYSFYLGKCNTIPSLILLCSCVIDRIDRPITTIHCALTACVHPIQFILE